MVDGGSGTVAGAGVIFGTSVGGELTGVTGEGWSAGGLSTVAGGDGGDGKLTGVTPDHDSGSDGTDIGDKPDQPKRVPCGLTAAVRLESRLGAVSLAPRSAGDL